MIQVRSAPLLVKIALGIVAVLSLLAIFAGPLSPHDIETLNLRARFEAPVFMGGTWEYPLGTDNLGKDMLSLTLRAIQVSFVIAALGTIGGAIIGTALGLAAAWIGGLVDEGVGILVDFFATMPFLVIALALLAAIPEADMGLFIVLMIIYGWERYCRLARAIGLKAQGEAYIQAQRVLGASAWRIATRSILPNAMAVLLVNMSLNFPATILIETSINFLGIGIQPPDTSLGVLIGEGRAHLYNAPWIALVPGFLILIATVSISILGDWARDLVETD